MHLRRRHNNNQPEGGVIIHETEQTLAHLLLFLVLIPKTSFAHAYITNSNPGENSELKQAPKQIEIEFNEQIEEGFHSIKVYNSSGERVDAGKTVIQKMMPAS